MFRPKSASYVVIETVLNHIVFGSFENKVTDSPTLYSLIYKTQSHVHNSEEYGP